MIHEFQLYSTWLTAKGTEMILIKRWCEYDDETRKMIPSTYEFGIRSEQRSIDIDYVTFKTWVDQGKIKRIS